MHSPLEWRPKTSTIDLLFVNAGFSIRAPLEHTEAIYDEMFNLNAKGPLFAVQVRAANKPGGSVILTTSIANVEEYSATRHTEPPRRRCDRPCRSDARC